MKGSITVRILAILVVLLAVGMIAYIFIGISHHTTPISTNTSLQPSSTIPVKDFAPSLPTNQKTTILIQLSDSSEVKYVVPTNQVDTYIKSLPEGYHVISKTP